jgi:DNA-directed RNA polymerase subunit RPC12/RpoP
MLCATCGSKLNELEEAIDGQLVYECSTCENRFNESGDLMTAGEDSKRDTFVHPEVRNKIEEEIFTHLTTSEVRMDLTQTDYIDD